MTAVLAAALLVRVLPAADRPAWSEIEEPEQRLVRSLLDSPHWPMRALVLMRLERYRGPEVEAFVKTKVADETWQVRCFALRAAHRIGIELAPEVLAGEREGRVIRAAVRRGFTIEPVHLERGARKLLRTKRLDQLMLGLEIAAATESQPVRREAAGRLRRLLQNLDEPTLVRVSRRLAAVLGLDEEPPTIEAWTTWARANRDRLVLAPPRAPERDAAPLVAGMDMATFSRLLDYLGALRQRTLELAIVMDVTNSMTPMIDEARAGVESFILFLDDIARTLRVAMIAYRDHDNPPVWEGQRLTSDVAAIRRFLFDIKITGGRDLPEAVLEGLTACGDLDWTKDAARQIVLVGDARPHDEDTYKLTGLLETFRANEIVVHAVHVPMRMHPLEVQRLPPEFRERRRQEIADHNARTAAAFAEVARLGGGELVTLDRARQLVPAIMHLTIEEAWWPAFDEFYAVYLELCR